MFSLIHIIVSSINVFQFYYNIFDCSVSEGLKMRNSTLFIFFILLFIVGCDEDSTSPEQENSLKISIVNAVAGSKLYYSICDGSVSDEDIMNENVTFLIQDMAEINSAQETITVLKSNVTGTFNCETGNSYKIAYYIDVPPLEFDYTNQTGYGTGDGGGLVEFTANAGETIANIDYTQMQWKID